MYRITITRDSTAIYCAAITADKVIDLLTASGASADPGMPATTQKRRKPPKATIEGNDKWQALDKAGDDRQPSKKEEIERLLLASFSTKEIIDQLNVTGAYVSLTRVRLKKEGKL